MNILHINQSDISGGAAIAAYRLHQALLAEEIDSKLLVGTAKTKSDRVAPIPRKYRLEKQISRFSHSLSLKYVEFVGSFNIPQHDFYREADILNFHNLHTGHFSYLAIPALTKQKPTVLTLHDMWSFTGHCAYSYDCDRWKIGCGHCPYPNSYPEIQRDSSHLEWKLKDWVYSKANLTIVTPSHWLTGLAKQSMLNRFPIHHIPNGVDTQIFQPLDAEQCRSVLGIPHTKRVITFAANSLVDSRKGGDLLFKALSNLPEILKAETLLLTLGDESELSANSVGIEMMNLGYVSSDRLKAIAYSAADLFAFPTRADNLPLVLQESMACGTPMVSFDIGGVPDLVRPGITGYLAEPEDAIDFCSGLIKLLDNRDLLQQMQQNCRTIALAEYSIEHQAARYTQLYQQVLGKL